MKINEPIVIFGYSFPHRKTCDFLMILFELGFQNIVVIGAPKIKLAHGKDSENINAVNLSSYCVKTLCHTLNIEFQECAHDNLRKILSIKDRIKSETAIISGSRILKKEVIDLFANGVVNFHPGMIPETSGLDSFFYSIKKNCPMGVTVHHVDHKVDAGRFVFFEKLRIERDQSIKDVRENLYGIQLISFKKYLLSYFGREYNFPDIDRPQKNPPMTFLEKEAVTLYFEQWKNNQITEQAVIEEKFFRLCAVGKLEEVRDLIESNTYLINCRSKEGWSGIIISSFWQRLEIVRYFLELGANPNDVGQNGTTVLMYAKTKIVELKEPDMSLLRLLVEAGANQRQRDKFGKDIFNYLDRSDGSQRQIFDYLKSCE